MARYAKGPEVRNPKSVEPGAMVILKPPGSRRQVSGIVLGGAEQAVIYIGGTLEQVVELAACKVKLTWQIYYSDGTPFTVADTLELHNIFAGRLAQLN